MPDYPKSLKVRGQIDRKLGIKSSLADLKPLFALTYSLWLASSKVAVVEYSDEVRVGQNNSIEIKPDLFEKLKGFFLNDTPPATNESNLLTAVNNNPLFKNQLEPLLVCLELFGKIAKISFAEIIVLVTNVLVEIDSSKKLFYTTNIDIINIYLEDRDGKIEKDGKSLLLKWIEKKPDSDEDLTAAEKVIKRKLQRLLMIFTEDTRFKIRVAGSGDIQVHAKKVSMKDS